MVATTNRAFGDLGQFESTDLLRRTDVHNQLQSSAGECKLDFRDIQKPYYAKAISRKDGKFPKFFLTRV